MSESIIKVLNIVSIILSMALVICGGSIIFKNIKSYDNTDECQNKSNNIFIFILITIGIGIIGYNVRVLNQVTDVCKIYYTDKYNGIWELFEVCMIYQSVIICIGLINFILYIMDTSICKGSD